MKFSRCRLRHSPAARTSPSSGGATGAGVVQDQGRAASQAGVIARGTVHARGMNAITGSRRQARSAALTGPAAAPPGRCRGAFRTRDKASCEVSTATCTSMRMVCPMVSTPVAAARPMHRWTTPRRTRPRGPRRFGPLRQARIDIDEQAAGAIDERLADPRGHHALALAQEQRRTRRDSSSATCG